MDFEELKSFLDEKAEQYNTPDFITDDPIQMVHRFTEKEDMEIMGFLSATIAWGNRKSIIKSAEKMLDYMGNAPFDFVKNHTNKDLERFEGKSLHRTFNGEDFSYFIKRLKNVYENHNSLENLFLLEDNETNFYHSLHRFRTEFLGEIPHRSHKHISSTYKNSSAKRLMMFLRWMVRKDKKGVDLGIWKQIDQRFLSIPLDVHTGNISRKLGIVTRKQNDWKTL
ncbi:MAG: TIGR02757 family protein, partial [Bergeyella zoohelcum]|nr:TIGR02757 family protein [Bergeyella zoohelcum]